MLINDNKNREFKGVPGAINIRDIMALRINKNIN